MLQPPGFSQHSLTTSLGEMVYYTADAAPWLPEEGSLEPLPTLVFLHGFGGGSSAYERKIPIAWNMPTTENLDLD